MIMFNTLSTSLKCPFCGTSASHRVKLAFGETRVMGRYNLGDRYPWRPGLPVERGGRPKDGDFSGDSTSRCPECHQVFNVHIYIHNDVIRSVEPDRARQSSSPVRWLDGRVQARSHIPEPARSLLDEDLLSRGRAILARIQQGEISDRNSELCVLLYDLGEALRQKGQFREACQVFYHTQLMANQLQLTGWSTIASVALQELRQEYDLGSPVEASETTVQELLAGCLCLLQADQA